jgi:signal transduction histidine kinase
LQAPVGKLFERFYRAGNRGTSLGLGLSLVKKICELNQLVIDYEYRENQHCFCIRRLGA